MERFFSGVLVRLRSLRDGEVNLILKKCFTLLARLWMPVHLYIAALRVNNYLNSYGREFRVGAYLGTEV